MTFALEIDSIFYKTFYRILSEAGSLVVLDKNFHNVAFYLVMYFVIDSAESIFQV